MNEDQRQLLGDLRSLAADGPTEAPAAVRERLLVEFRRRAARKRQIARFSAAGLGAIAAAVLLAVWIPQQLRHSPTTAAIQSNPAPAPAADEIDSAFYPLPEAEGLPPIESATVIRVQMPVASLQLMGLPVSEEGAADPIQAEILLGQDGLARGVRLVQ